jgi:3-oxoacyl-(acyl-carrier-protein) synthase
VDALLAVHMLDTNHAACVSELLGTHGPIATVGASCASGNLGLRAAMDELEDGASAVVVVAPIYDYGPTTLQCLGRMGATSESADPTASRPFDATRTGFVPSHGAAAVVIEPLERARARNVPVLAEILACEAGSDASHRPPRPSPEDQAALIRSALDAAGITPSDLDLVSAHAASTPAGDLAEALALQRALGSDADKIPVNAAKSMLGHTGWSAALIEVVIAITQMRRGAVHGTANLTQRDPRVSLRLDAAGERDVRTVLNNAFGFGGLNCVSVLRRGE